MKSNDDYSKKTHIDEQFKGMSKKRTSNMIV